MHGHTRTCEHCAKPRQLLPQQPKQQLEPCHHHLPTTSPLPSLPPLPPALLEVVCGVFRVFDVICCILPPAGYLPSMVCLISSHLNGSFRTLLAHSCCVCAEESVFTPCFVHVRRLPGPLPSLPVPVFVFRAKSQNFQGPPPVRHHMCCQSYWGAGECFFFLVVCCRQWCVSSHLILNGNFRTLLAHSCCVCAEESASRHASCMSDACQAPLPSLPVPVFVFVRRVRTSKVLPPVRHHMCCQSYWGAGEFFFLVVCCRQWCVSSHLISMVTFARSWHILAVSVLRSRLHAMLRACPTLARPPFPPSPCQCLCSCEESELPRSSPGETSHVLSVVLGCW